MTPKNNTPTLCVSIREQMSPYLDGRLTGHEMTALAAHLSACALCHAEFADLRAIQAGLSDLGAATAPDDLPARITARLDTERSLATHLSPLDRFDHLWRTLWAPVAVPVLRGIAAAFIIAVGFAGIVAAPLQAVQASDLAMTQLVAPHYLYSQMPQLALPTRGDAPVIVEAKVDAQGRICDYRILEGPTDARTRARVETNLMSSVFQPATLFGTPVAARVVITYSDVSVQG